MTYPTALPRWITSAVAALLVTGLTLPASAQWKWRDKGGQMQYSDLPPPASVADRDILQRPTATQRAAASSPGSIAASSSASAASAQRAPALTPKGIEPELEAKRRQGEQDESNKRKADELRLAATRAENCRRAQANLRTLESGTRLGRTNEKGEREILDDAARAVESRIAREAIASDCR